MHTRDGHQVNTIPRCRLRSDLALQIDFRKLRQRLDEVPLSHLAVERLVAVRRTGRRGLVSRCAEVGEEGVRFVESVERELGDDKGKRNGEISTRVPIVSARRDKEGEGGTHALLMVTSA